MISERWCADCEVSWVGSQASPCWCCEQIGEDAPVAPVRFYDEEMMNELAVAR